MIIPEEVKTAVSALSHQIRWRIIELIQEHETLSYTEILQRLDIRKGRLTHHLNRLMEAGMIDNYSGDEFRGPFSSYYQLSPFGEDLIAGLLSSFQFKPIPSRVEAYEPGEVREPTYAVKPPSNYVGVSKTPRHEYVAKQLFVLLKDLAPATKTTSLERHEKYRVVEPKLYHKRRVKGVVFNE